MFLSIIIIFTVILAEPFLETGPLPVYILILEAVYLLPLFLRGSKRINLKFMLLCMYLLLMLFWSLICNPTSYYNYILRISTYFMQIVIGMELFKHVLSNPDYKKIIVTVCIVLITLMASYCIMEGILKSNPLFVEFFRDQWQAKVLYGYARGYRSAGSMESPLVMSFPILLCLCYSYMQLREKGKRIYALPFSVCLFSLIYFQTRTTYMCAFISILIIEYKHLGFKKSRLKWNVLFIVLLITFIGFINSDYLITLFSGDLMSYINRENSINYVIHQMESLNPIYILIGHGYGSISYKIFSEKVTITTSGFYAIDNEYITMLYEFGVLGILLLVVIFSYLLKTIKHISIEKKALFEGYFVCIAIYLMSFNFFHWFSLATIAAFLLGGLFSDCTNNRMLQTSHWRR